MESNLQSLELVLKKQLLTTLVSHRNVSSPYPIVFASRTVHGDALGIAESLAFTSLKLGRDDRRNRRGIPQPRRRR